MPQLDKLSFLNQLIWFFFFYIIFYFLMVKTFVPTIGRSLKLRHKLLTNLNTTQSATTEETQTIIKLALSINSQIQTVFSAIATNNLYKETFLDVINADKATAKLKAVYVKELAKILAKKKLLLKK